MEYKSKNLREFVAQKSVSLGAEVEKGINEQIQKTVDMAPLFPDELLISMGNGVTDMLALLAGEEPSGDKSELPPIAEIEIMKNTGALYVSEEIFLRISGDRPSLKAEYDDALKRFG